MCRETGELSSLTPPCSTHYDDRRP
jgi:hypothetical protein